MDGKAVAVPAPTPDEIDRQFAARRKVVDLEAGITSDGSVDTWIKANLITILEADSFEAINAAMNTTGLTPAKTLVGRTFEIQDFALRESADAYREKSALQKFGIVKAVDTSTGEEFIIDGGGDKFVAGLVGMRDLYGFPYTGTLLAMQTGSGYDMHYWRFHNPGRAPLNKG